MTPAPTDRYAVTYPGTVGPCVSYWASHQMVISLLANHSNNTWPGVMGFSVWHRRSAKARWVCISI